MNLTLIGWLHTLACTYSLLVGATLLWRAKGGAAHKEQGRRYIYAMAFANLSALAIYQIGSFNVFHVLALCTLASVAIAFASARWRAPRRHWLCIHLTAIVFSYYQLVGGLINELFVRVPPLQGHQGAIALTQAVALIAALMLLSYFWGMTARGGIAAQAGLAAALVIAAAPVHAGDLTLELNGVNAGKGQLIIALYDSADKFLKKSARKLTVPAGAAAMTVKLEDIPPGDYAVSLYQDLNSNNKMDTHMFGIPAEPYGFSNNATGSMGPPKFAAAQFSVPAAGKAIAITLHD